MVMRLPFHKWEIISGDSKHNEDYTHVCFIKILLYYKFNSFEHKYLNKILMFERVKIIYLYIRFVYSERYY